MPPLYAIPTTAGTGSEVGRSGVIIMKETGRKTIFFHPELLPSIAVLDPELTVGLPPHVTAATGIDALSHCLEAYFSPGFHPMADGIALQGIELIIQWLPAAFKDGLDIIARERMLIAASMGATAFQKGLGMIHSIAHPLSGMFGMHHGLANALVMPAAAGFLEDRCGDPDQKRRINEVRSLFPQSGCGAESLSGELRHFIEGLGVNMGLAGHGVGREDLERLADEAFLDPCHGGNMVPVTRDDLLKVIIDAF